MKNLLLLFSLLTITFTTTKAQNLIPLGDHYLYGENYISKEHALEVIQKDPEAYYYYQKSQNQFSSAKALGVTSIVTLSSGLLITLVSAPAAIISDRTATTAGFGLLLMAGGCLTGTIGLVKKKHANRNREKSLILYNQFNSQFKKDEYSIDLSFNGNGGGITYTF